MDLATIATQLKDLGTGLKALATLFGNGTGSFYEVVNTIAGWFGGEGSSLDGAEGSSALLTGSSEGSSSNLFAGSSES